MQKKINIAIVGLGNLGGELVRQIREKEAADANFPLCIVGAADKVANKYLPLQGVSFTHNYQDITDAANVDVVVEAIGGVSTAYDVISSAILAGKHVVSANAPLMATQGEKLLRQAMGAGVQLKLEGSLHGNSGWVRHLLSSASISKPERIYGVLGSMSNYVLMRMRELGETPQQALSAAEEFELGDKDVDYNLRGQDAMYRSTILRGLAYGHWSEKSEMDSTGISHIEPVDVKLASLLGYQIKLITVASENGVDVRPYLLSENTFFGATNGKMMALAFDSDSGSSFMACEDLGVKTAATGMLEDLLSLANGGQVQATKTSSPQSQAKQGKNTGKVSNVVPFKPQNTYFIRASLTGWEATSLPASYEILAHITWNNMVGALVQTSFSALDIERLFDTEKVSILDVWTQ